jgi:hypothetical protein
LRIAGHETIRRSANVPAETRRNATAILHETAESHRAPDAPPRRAIAPNRRRDPRETVERLRKLLNQYQRRRGAWTRERRAVVPTGVAALDAVLPGGGLPAGSLIEVLSGGLGTGGWTLAFNAALRACGQGEKGTEGRRGTKNRGIKGSRSRRAGRGIEENSKNGVKRAACAPTSTTFPSPSAIYMALPQYLVVIDCDGDFYPPAAVAMGADLQRLIVIRTPKPADAFWAADQALRCRAVGAVVATRMVLDGTRSRRLQLAAEASGALGLALAPAKNARPSTFAAVRLRVEGVGGEGKANSHSEVSHADTDFAAARKSRVTIVKVREGRPVEPIIVRWADAFDVSLHAAAADRTAPARRRTA